MTSRRPAILVATSHNHDSSFNYDYASLPDEYVEAIVAAGGMPLLVPPMADGPAWRQLVALGQAVLVIGGADIDPARYGQAKHAKTVLTSAPRTDADLRLLAWAERRRLPTMGICLGAQMLAVHRGGTLIQHVPDRFGDAVPHQRQAGQPRPRHEVRIDPASRLATFLGSPTVSANSSHHQAIDLPGRHLCPVAWSADGLIEAVEDNRPDRFVLGLQWHPEELLREPAHLSLFRALVRAARSSS
jgi:putative glutamine amidotransferase